MRQVGPNVAKVAALIADPVRARMLFALLDGREMSASELAYQADASPQAASGHLSKLVLGGLLTGRALGRQRLFSLASVQVAHAIETLASIAPPTPIVSLDQNLLMHRIAQARSCYDHLAGRLGVGITDALLRRRVLVLHSDEFHLTARGQRFFFDLGIDIEAARGARRSFARACMDWTERRWHLAGSLGAALLDHALAHQWVSRASNDRSLRVTAAGQREIGRIFGIP